MPSLHRARRHTTATTLLVIAIAVLDATEARAQQACLPAPDEAVGSVTDFLNDTAEAGWRTAHGITAAQATSLPQLTDVSDAAVCRRIDSMMVKKPAFHFRTGGYIIVTDAGPLTADPRTGLTRISHRQHIFVFDSVGWFVYSPRLRVQLAFIPTTFRVLNATAAQVNLAWRIHPLSGLTYQLQRAPGSGVFANVGAPLSTGVETVTDSGVRSGKSYRYRLLAKTASGDSGYTNEVSVTPGAITRADGSTLPTGFPVRCAPGEVEVMLLGTYHFANPGADAVKAEVVDVLQPTRQAELGNVVAGLARWRPDMIAVEWPRNFADSTRARYGRYVTGTLPPNRDEVVQIGFRLAKRLGHVTVYPIDHQMPIGNDSIGALYARRPELKRSADSVLARLQARADSAAPVQRRQSILEHLREANSDDALHGGNSEGMFGALLPAGEGDNYGGPQVLARWYERNIRMVHNLTRSLPPGARRVLLIVGSGHVPPLRNILDESPQFCPVSPLPYLH